MNQQPTKCLKCGGEFKPGILIDRFDRNPIWDYADQMEWVEGESTARSSWTGAIKLKGRARRKVRALCCDNCGALELYAFEQVES